MRTKTRQTGSVKSIVKLVLAVVLIVLAGWVFTNREMLNDQVVLANYDPPAEIKKLARDADLSEQGKTRFYVNKPELRGKQTFSQLCGGVIHAKESNVLGCFKGNKIYIYDVPDGKLKGIEEVTAAHEVLHAAYDRLSASDKKRVTSLLKRQEKKFMAPHVQELAEAYANLGPEGRLNEMHSIFGTEQKKLMPELEEYYSQYFNDRNNVVKLAANYRKVFNSLQKQQEDLVKRLDALAAQIDSSTFELNQRIDVYNAAVKEFNQRARSGDMSEEEYYSQKGQLDAEMASIEAAITENENLRAEYERLRKEYKSLSIQLTELQSDIDSSPPKL